MSFINRRDEKFTEFLKKYWWIEILVIAKVIYFIDKGFYKAITGTLIIFCGLVVLWILYRLGLK